MRGNFKGSHRGREKREKMPGFPTKTVGTPANRGKARRYKQ
jgi:hypothetical protein